jgi:hypothetical protein
MAPCSVAWAAGENPRPRRAGPSSALAPPCHHPPGPRGCPGRVARARASPPVRPRQSEKLTSSRCPSGSGRHVILPPIPSSPPPPPPPSPPPPLARPASPSSFGCRERRRPSAPPVRPRCREASTASPPPSPPSPAWPPRTCQAPTPRSPSTPPWEPRPRVTCSWPPPAPRPERSRPPPQQQPPAKHAIARTVPCLALTRMPSCPLPRPRRRSWRGGREPGSRTAPSRIHRLAPSPRASAAPSAGLRLRHPPVHHHHRHRRRRRRRPGRRPFPLAALPARASSPWTRRPTTSSSSSKHDSHRNSISLGL